MSRTPIAGGGRTAARRSALLGWPARSPGRLVQSRPPGSLCRQRGCPRARPDQESRRQERAGRVARFCEAASEADAPTTGAELGSVARTRRHQGESVVTVDQEVRCGSAREQARRLGVRFWDQSRQVCADVVDQAERLAGSTTPSCAAADPITLPAPNSASFSPSEPRVATTGKAVGLAAGKLVDERRPRCLIAVGKVESLLLPHSELRAFRVENAVGRGRCRSRSRSHPPAVTTTRSASSVIPLVEVSV